MTRENMTFKTFHLTIIIFLLLGCGNSSETTPPSDNEHNSLKNLELYSANLKLIKGSQRYNIEKIDAQTTNLSSLYYNIETQQFNILENEQLIFVNKERDNHSNIEYMLNSNGDIIASLNEINIYTLALKSTEQINKSYFEEYRSDINITGKAYQTTLNYLSNFYIIEDLFSNRTFDSLSEFTQAYEQKVFLGDYAKGLIFAKDNKLQEFNNGSYSEAGSYEIKNIDNQEILFIYPTNIKSYYANNSCYLLDFSRVWKAKCYLKGTNENKVFYDKNVYDNLLNYLQNSFIKLEFSI